MVKNGLSLVVVAMVLGQVSATGWFWSAPSATPSTETHVNEVVEQQAAGNVEETVPTTTTTEAVQVTQAQVDQMFLQSMVVIPNDTEVVPEEVKVEETKTEVVPETKPEEPKANGEEVAVPAPESQPSSSWGILGWLGYGAQPVQPAQQTTPQVAEEPTPTYETKESIASEFHVMTSSSSSAEAVTQPTAVPVAEVPEVAKAAEVPEAVEVATAAEEPTATVQATPVVSSGWSIFRLWSSPSPVVETPKVAEQSLEAAVAEAVVAAEQPTVENPLAISTVVEKSQKRQREHKKTLSTKSAKRQAFNDEASRPYRFRSEKKDLSPVPMVHASVKTVEVPKTATLATVSNIFNALAKDKQYARYHLTHVPADLMQFDRIVQLAKAYGFEVNNKEARSLFVTRVKFGSALMSKLLVDDLVREDVRRKNAELVAKATPSGPVVEEVKDLVEELSATDAIPTTANTITTDINPFVFGRESFPSKNIPHRQKSVLRRKRTIIPAKGKSSVTSSRVNKRTMSLNAKLTNGKRAMNAAEIKGAIKEAMELMKPQEVELVSSDDSSFDDELLNMRTRKTTRINKANFPPLTATTATAEPINAPNGKTFADVTKYGLMPSDSSSSEPEAPIFDMNKFFAREYFGGAAEVEPFDLNELFYGAQNAAKSEDDPIFDMNKFFTRDRFTGTPEIEPFDMHEFFHPTPAPTPRAPAKIGPNGHVVRTPRKNSPASGNNNQRRGGVPAGRGRGRGKWVPKKTNK